MFHLAGYFQNVNTAALSAINALSDQALRVSGLDIVVPDRDGMNYLCGMYYQAANALRAQLRSPSQARMVFEEIYQVNRAAALASNPNFVDLRDSPILLDPAENLEFWMANDAGAGQDQYGLIWISNGRVTPITGDIRSVRVTGSTTLVAKQWSNVAVTFDQSLPAGRYQLVGARFASAGMIAFRAVPIGYQWRPGALGQIAASDVGRPDFRHGRFGVWCEFTHLTPPTFDFLSTSADVSQTGVLDLIKVG